jgi:hypothetical protein
MFQIVSNIYNRSVVTSMSPEEFVMSMKNPDIIRKSQVDLARDVYKKSELGKNDPVYKNIKNSLPCIAFLNTFNGYVSNENVIEPTGYMYLDIDNISYIDLSEYSFVVSYWKSVSNNGYGALIKYKKEKELNLQNCVTELSNFLNMEFDKNAVSIDRLNIMGYDYNIYFNDKSTEYVFKTSVDKVVSFSHINNKLINRLEVIDTVYSPGNLRFSNLTELIKDYNFDGNPFIDLGDNKLQYAEVFVPKEIFDGNRNKSMFVLCSQIRGLNTWITEDYLFKICNTINKDKFKPQLDLVELSEIVRKVFNKKEPVVMLNKTKRILFNPDYILTTKEKRSMTAIQIRGEEAKKNTKKIMSCLNSWDFEKLGKVSQAKLAKETGFGIATIKRRAEEINGIYKILNEEYLHNTKNNCIFAN